MNILQIKYAVEVARLGSINRAAEELYIAQPNLSRYIRELESELGISIFKRSHKGMVPTPEGETFIRYAEQILGQVDDLEKLYKGEASRKQKFSISVPRASYIADAFVQFTRGIDAQPTEIYYMETNTQKAIRNLLESDYHLGIIRYAVEDDDYFKRMLAEKDIVCELTTDFTYVLIASQNSVLAQREAVFYADLATMIEISHGDPFVPSMSPGAMRRRDLPNESERSILLFERGGQFDLLCENPETYMWVSPIPDKLLVRYNLIQCPCVDKQRVYRDVLIRRRDYSLTPLDRQFIEELRESKRRTLEKVQ